MYCHFCGTRCPHYSDVPDSGWILKFYDVEGNKKGPVCPDCSDKHLIFTESGDYVIGEASQNLALAILTGLPVPPM